MYYSVLLVFLIGLCRVQPQGLRARIIEGGLNEGG